MSARNAAGALTQYQFFTGPAPNMTAVRDCGSLDRCYNSGYPKGSFFGPSGRIWTSGTSGEGYFTISKIEKDDQ